MVNQRPATTGYARLAQAEEFSEDEDEDLEDMINSRLSLQPAAAPRYASITQPRPHAGMHTDGTSTPVGRRPRNSRRHRSNSSGVDLKAINARLERWADEIASKFKIHRNKGKSEEDERLEIHHSVFQAPEGVRPVTADSFAADSESGRMTKDQFDAIVESVRIAIEQGIHPKMISQGSSGSYFARNTEGKTVGVFKPKDEEPYAAGNPKWNKWIHRNLFPCFFGRACLIPNLSYVSEAAAYTLDCRLKTNLVPYTDIVNLSSKSFHYNYFTRRNYYRNKKPLPGKAGSFQIFLQGFSDANIFLRKHPWPDQHNGGFRPSDAPKKKVRPWADACRPSGTEDEDDEDTSATPEETQRRRFFWTDALQASFRQELEKLVILDYIMRNTDRGLDNWMIKVDWDSQAVSIVSDPPQMNGFNGDSMPARPVSMAENIGLSDLNKQDPYRQQRPMNPASATEPTPSMPVISIGAIDNSLSWPWKHPDAWRSYPFGWLFLPVSLIGQPFSQKTRDHFLPLLTSKEWWSETQLELRKIFVQDPDFKERMFARQIAVMKGQAWNVVETLKTPDHGPLELTRRARVCVWDDLVDIPVAMPLRPPSLEMRRRTDTSTAHTGDDEIDISVATSSGPQDLIRFGSPPAEMPNPNRFELSPRASEDASRHKSPEGQSMITRESPQQDQNTKSAQVTFSEQSNNDRLPPGRSSYNGPTRTGPSHSRREIRRFSFSARRGSVSQLFDNDVEGDLGYAAAEGMEGNRRKVIVERLETVKSKNPVFTWC